MINLPDNCRTRMEIDKFNEEQNEMINYSVNINPVLLFVYKYKFYFLVFIIAFFLGFMCGKKVYFKPVPPQPAIPAVSKSSATTIHDTITITIPDTSKRAPKVQTSIDTTKKVTYKVEQTFPDSVFVRAEVSSCHFSVTPPSDMAFILTEVSPPRIETKHYELRIDTFTVSVPTPVFVYPTTYEKTVSFAQNAAIGAVAAIVVMSIIGSVR